MGRDPEAKARAGDSRLQKSPPSSIADTPCRSAKAARLEFLSDRAQRALESAGAFAITLDLEQLRLREESAVADGRGAWNPT
jgi:hypothetical protein